MKHNAVQDERILLVRRKIRSDAYGWLVSFLMCSVIIQQFFMRAPLAQYAVEFFLLIGCGIYSTVRHLREGIDIWHAKGGNKKNLLTSAVLVSAASVIFYALLSGENEAKDLATFFVTMVLCFLLFQSVILAIAGRRQRSIERRLDEQENGGADEQEIGTAHGKKKLK